jgi:hypothetical protein
VPPPAGLDLGWLTKFVQQQFTKFPDLNFNQLLADQAIVSRKLTVQDEVDFQAYKEWRFVGSAGQPVFTNSWVNFTSPSANASFLKGPDGFISLHGVIKSGTVGSSAFALPPGYRPVAPIEFIVASNSTTGRVVVNTDGTVVPSTPSSNVSVTLDQIRFKSA